MFHNKYFLFMVIFALTGVTAANGVDAGGGRPGQGQTQSMSGMDEGNAAVIPAEVPDLGSMTMISGGIEFGFGNILMDDYAFAGKNGQAFVKPSIGIMKAFGPLMLSGQVAKGFSLAFPDAYNTVEMNLTPLLMIPQANLVVGAMFSAAFPFHEGRLVASQAQVPSASPFQSIAGIGITPGFQYTQPFNWGAIYWTFLFMTSRPFSANDWNLSGSTEIGVRTEIGFTAHVAPEFSFLQMGETPEDYLSSFRVQFGYMNPGFPMMSMLTFYLPGTQEDGFKNFGIMINPAVAFAFNPMMIAWAGVGLMGVGNGVGEKIWVMPQMGFSLQYPHMSRPVDSSTADASNETQPSKWHVGLAAGYVNNDLYTSTGGRLNTDYERGHGFEIAIPVRYGINNWLGIQGEVQYIQKKYTLRRSGPYDGVYSTVTNSLIDLPLMANFSVGGEKLKAFANVGVYAGLWIDSRMKGKELQFSSNPFNPDALFYSDYNERVKFDSGRDARFDGGLLAGLGVQYDLSPFIVFAEGRYYHGLTDLQQNYGANLVPKKNSSINARIGAIVNTNFLRSLWRGN